MLPSHEDLVSELPKLNKLSAGDRKQLNDNRRASQLESWKARQSTGEEDEWEKHPRKRKKTEIRFDPGLILLNCAALGDIDGVQKLLNQGVSPTVYNVDRITPLHQSALENDEDISQLLIDAGCDIDSLDNELWTPLHASVSLANVECTKLLLQHGASQLVANVDGQLPIDLCEDKAVLAVIEQDLLAKGITQAHLATARTSQETKFFNEVKQLLENGGNPNFQLLDNDATLLHVAAANGYVEVALYLLSKSCKVDVQDIDGWTALHAATFWEEVDIIELLAAHGADFKIRTFSGELPIDLTEDQDIKSLVQRLSDRSELMKNNPGAILRPSSVRGRLVSRMTTGEREDKRRESAELHNFFVEQIEKDVAKAPDSWRIRTGKFVRPALRDVNFDNNQLNYPPEGTDEKLSENLEDTSDAPGEESLESTANMKSPVDEPPCDSSVSILSAICENGENASPQLKTDPISADDTSATFELMSPSSATLDLEGNWHLRSSPSTPKGSTDTSFVCANKTSELRKLESVEDLINTTEESVGAPSAHQPLLRSTSLSYVKPPSQNHAAVKRFHSFRSGMQDQAAPRFSPKPRNNKTAYKNRKKASSSASKQSSLDDEVMTSNSVPSSSGNQSYLVSQLTPEETEARPMPAAVPVVEPTTPPASPGKKQKKENDVTKSDQYLGDNSMATNAGSLSSGVDQQHLQQQPATSAATVQSEARKSKSKKCCVIL